MRSLRSLAPRAWSMCAGRGLAALAVAAVGALAVPAAHAGGLLVSDGNQVFRYNSITGAFVNTFAPGEGGMGSPEGMVLRPDGAVYLAAFSFNSVLRQDAQTGSPLGGFVAPDAGGLKQPHGIAFGPDGNLYVCSLAKNAILRYNGATGAFIDAFVPAESGGLMQPWAAVFGPDGHLYVTSAGTHNVLRYNGHTGEFMNEFVPAGSGGLSGPRGLAFGPDGNLYVCSHDNDLVLRYNGQTGAFLGTFIDGPASNGGLSHPTGLLFGADNNLYVCSSGSGSVLRYNGQTGAFVSIFVTQASGGLAQPQFLLFAPPQAPDALTATAISSGRVNLTWAEHSDDETAFAIWRKTGTDAFSRIGVVTNNVTSYSDLAVSGNTSYTYQVRAIGPGGASAWTNMAGVTTPVAVPAAPTALTANISPSGRINLTWADNSSNETAFAVWRTTGAGDFTKIAALAPNTTVFADTTVSPSSSYTYRVRAINQGGASGWTNETSATTPPPAPGAPTDLALNVLSPTRIALNWTDNSANETAFAIWRKIDAGAWERIATVVPNTISFVDHSVSPGTGYTYRVRAVNQGGASAWTAEVSATTPLLPPAAPGGLSASVVSSARIDLTWTDNSSNETAFAVWRKIGAGDWERIAVVAPNTTSFSDITVSAGTAYTYRVRAIGLSSASTWTDEIGATTP